jgi:periplasmic mercuric ion binding protein
MKSIKFIIAAICAVVLSVGSINAQNPSQSSKTETFKVSGNCELCKSRIEKAAKIDGVSKAEWNSNTKIITLVYNPAKVSSDAVLKKIAAAGHDNEKYKADDKTYNKLPGCCKYR